MPTALVTGATVGIGAALSRALARRGHHLVLVARDSERLAATAGRLAADYGVDTEVLAADLTDEQGLALVEQRLTDPDRPVDMLVNNAGYGTIGDFWTAPIDGEVGQVKLHVLATLRLTHAALPGMVARGTGAVVNVSSVAGLLPGASGATYGATKAFQAVFSQVLAPTLRPHGVRVMALCPGFTRTEFHQRASMDVTRLPAFAWLSADRVAEEGLRDLERGRVISIPARRYRWLVTAAELIPRPVASRFAVMAGSGRRPGGEATTG